MLETCFSLFRRSGIRTGCQGAGGVPTLEALNRRLHLGLGAVVEWLRGAVAAGGWLDWMIWKVSSSPGDSVILLLPTQASAGATVAPVVPLLPARAPALWHCAALPSTISTPAKLCRAGELC